LAILAHILHWLWAGRTLSPVEPSETVDALKTGRVNAGAIFLCVSVAVTLIFGRYFCGWGCHFIAYQDLCAWIMKKLGVTPKPLRARLLLFVPLGVAFYMFAWPVVYRWISGAPEPPLTSHLTTTRFWATFPGALVAGLTVVTCGFAVVYFLGAKGFCTYGCPYGALYGLADQVAPGRIRVNENCTHTGECTRVCTSNVDVAGEVARYGMVVDPGCMKCRDCISHCPNDALYYGFGSPPIVRDMMRRLRGKTASPPRPAGAPHASEPGRAASSSSSEFRVQSAERHSSPATRNSNSTERATPAWPEEFALVLLFVPVFFCWRGLYEMFPLLLSVGLSGIICFAVVLAARLIHRSDVTLQNLVFKRAGRWRFPGWVLAAGTLLIVVATVHGGFVQYHLFAGNRLFDRINSGPESMQDGFDPSHDLTAEQRRLRDDCRGHFDWLRRWSLRDTALVRGRLGSLNLLAGDRAGAEREIRRALELAPEHAPLHHLLAGVLIADGRLGAAVDSLRTALHLDPELPRASHELGLTLLAAGRLDEALDHYREQVRRHPDAAEEHHHLGQLLAVRGDLAGAREHLERALELAPQLPETHGALGSVLLSLRETERAADHFAEAVRLYGAEPTRPDCPPACAEALYNLGVARFMQGRLTEAEGHVRASLECNPADAQAHAFLAQVLLQLRKPGEAAEHARRAAELDPRFGPPP